ncbi:MAG TPA: nucleotidyltransferase domain-containing protein [Ktedonobacteraceae bacterium]
MSEEKCAAIQSALSQVETEDHVHILYACESGSRAWGFASVSSDYDVRFIYTRHPLAYLRLDIPQDVIELPIKDDLDINGWDIFKGLRLLRKSNPPLLEWLTSPIVYRGGETSAIRELRTLARQGFSPNTLRYHYWQMARGNWQQYLRGKSEVLLKKYLYVLRPLATLIYLEQHQLLPPVDFIETLMAVQIDHEIVSHILALVEQKRAGEEMGMGATDPVLHGFIEVEMGRIEQRITPNDDAMRRHLLSQGCEAWLSKVLDAVANIKELHP